MGWKQSPRQLFQLVCCALSSQSQCTAPLHSISHAPPPPPAFPTTGPNAPFLGPIPHTLFCSRSGSWAWPGATCIWHVLQVVERQQKWVQEVISQSKADWVLVVGHHPVYSGGHYPGGAGVAEALVPLFKTHGVAAYFDGHDHNMQHLSHQVRAVCTSVRVWSRPFPVGMGEAGTKGAHRALSACCAKSRLFSITDSHGSQGPEVCTPDAILN